MYILMKLWRDCIFVLFISVSYYKKQGIIVKINAIPFNKLKVKTHSYFSAAQNTVC